MLPQIILDELFNLAKRIDDVVIDHICSILEEDYRYNIMQINNNDLAITIIFHNTYSECELRIDRLACRFELSARHCGYTYIPVTGDWELVLKCLDELNSK